MKKQPKTTDDVVVQLNERRPSDRGEGDAMSASMRELILSFVGTEDDRSWDPTAFTRRPPVQPA